MSVTETAERQQIKLTPDQRQEYIAQIKPTAKRAQELYKIQKFTTAQQQDAGFIPQGVYRREVMIKKEWGSEEDRIKAGEEIELLKKAARAAMIPPFLSGIQQGFNYQVDAIKTRVAQAERQSEVNYQEQAALAEQQALAEKQAMSLDRPGYVLMMTGLANRYRDTRRFIEFFSGQTQALRTELYNLQQALAENSLSRSDQRMYERRIARVQAELRDTEKNPPQEDEEVSRVLLNEIKSKAAAARIAKKVHDQEISPLESMFVSRTVQEAKPRPTISVREPGSPTLPHNDLGSLISQRKVNVVTRFHPDIAAEATLRWPQDRQMERIAMAVSQLLPEHALQAHTAPSYLKNPQDVATGIAEITQWVTDFFAGKREYPNVFQLGERGPKQKEHLVSYMETALAECLAFELANPNATEDEIRKRYLALGNSIRGLTQWIVEDRGQEEATETIHELLETGMTNDVATAMLTSRFSVNLLADLGFPGIEMVTPRRFAEFITKIAFDKNMPRRFQVASALFEALRERVENEDLDVERLFADLDSLDYIDHIWNQLTNFEEDAYKYRGKSRRENQVTLGIEADSIKYNILYVLRGSSRFRGLERELRLELEGSEVDGYSPFEDNLDDDDEETVSTRDWE